VQEQTETLSMLSLHKLASLCCKSFPLAFNSSSNVMTFSDAGPMSVSSLSISSACLYLKQLNCIGSHKSITFALTLS
jgi:hypothetical protein